MDAERRQNQQRKHHTQELKMNVMENMAMADILRRAGYEVVRETPCSVTVKDPAQCSSGGGKRWIVYDEVTLRSSAAVWKFIHDRE